MSMNITSEERDGKINKGRGMGEFVLWEGRSAWRRETKKNYSSKDVGHSRRDFY